MKFLVEVEDYHDFILVKNALKHLSKFNYKEIGMNESNRLYVGVFFDKKEVQQKEIDELLAQENIKLI